MTKLRTILILVLILGALPLTGCGLPQAARMVFLNDPVVLGGTDAGVRFETMTRNVYYGADLSPAMNAMLEGDVDSMLLSVGAIRAQIDATDFPSRARGLAEEVAAFGDGRGPEVLGLQEVALWRRQAPADSFDAAPTPAQEVLLDQLAVLLAALEARGLAYDVASVQPGFDAELPYLDPEAGLVDLRITDRDVLLVRRDVRYRNPFGGNFEARLSLPGLELPASYVGCDLEVEGTWVRVVSAHLDAQVADLRRAQVAELLTGPLAVDGHAVLLGDLNAELAVEGGDGSIDDLLVAGFDDAWSQTQPGEFGATWGLDADLEDPMASVTERLDYVWTRSGPAAPGAPGAPGASISAVCTVVTGLDPTDRVLTPDGRRLWHSDHAGVCATLRIR